MKTLRSPCAPVRGPAKPWMAGLCTTLSAAYLFACRKMRSRAEGTWPISLSTPPLPDRRECSREAEVP